MLYYLATSWPLVIRKRTGGVTAQTPSTRVADGQRELICPFRQLAYSARTLAHRLASSSASPGCTPLSMGKGRSLRSARHTLIGSFFSMRLREPAPESRAALAQETKRDLPSPGASRSLPKLSIALERLNEPRAPAEPELPRLSSSRRLSDAIAVVGLGNRGSASRLSCSCDVESTGVLRLG